MADVNYKDIKDAVIYSRMYDKLSDKTDNVNLKKRSVNSYILANLCVGFAKEFDLNYELAEAIVYARDICYPTFGEVAYSFLEKKNPDFNKLQSTIEFLKKGIFEPNNLELPGELTSGISDSFNEGEGKSKEGRLVYLLEKTVYTAQMNRDNIEEAVKFKGKLEDIWQELSKRNEELSGDDMCNQILFLTDTMIENEILDGE